MAILGAERTILMLSDPARRIVSGVGNCIVGFGFEAVSATSASYAVLTLRSRNDAIDPMM
jgi:hypothetical protein